jgi:hypothetical protein
MGGREPSMVRIDDILAALLMSLAMMRRLGVLSTLQEHNPDVRIADFERWKAMALGAYNLAALACLAKVVLSIGWFWFVRDQTLLRVGGFLIFGGWVVALVFAWYRATEARGLHDRLGIVGRRESER